MCKIKYEKQRERETGKVSPERRKHAKSVSSKENVNLFKKKKKEKKKLVMQTSQSNSTSLWGEDS